VVGLVAITPAAGFVGPMSALVLGAVAAFPSYYGIVWISRTRLDDSLDVVAAHGVGGLVGALLTGVLAHAAWGGSDGLMFGNPRQVIVQAIGVVVVALYSGAASFALLAIVSRFAALRADRRTEGIGLDVLEHGEEAYTSGEGAILILPDSGPRAAVAAALRDPSATTAGGVS
jgi:Amt family ammonium transporter